MRPRAMTVVNSSPPKCRILCVSELGQHWFRYWLVVCSALSHYLNQCWLIVNWALGNKLQGIRIEIQNFSFTKMRLKVSFAKWQPFCPGEMSYFAHGLQFERMSWRMCVLFEGMLNRVSMVEACRCVCYVRKSLLLLEPYYSIVCLFCTPYMSLSWICCNYTAKWTLW